MVHSPGPLWVLKSLPRNPRPARVSAGFQELSVDAVLSHQDPPFRGCIAHQSRSDRLIFTALSWIKGSTPRPLCLFSRRPFWGHREGKSSFWGPAFLLL